MRKTVVRWLCLTGGATAVLALVAGASQAAGKTLAPSSPVYSTVEDYVVHFYPRWVTYEQAREGTNSVNQLIGSATMSPVFGFVVAPNDDTVYTGSFFDVAAQPVIFTIPRTTATYSVLSMDMFGNVFPSISPGKPGRYAITGPGWSGNLPAGVIRVRIPVNFSFWITRADKYSSSGVNQTTQAEKFRAQLHLATLSAYEQNPSAGAITIRSVAFYSTRFQVLARDEIAAAPIAFLRQLQAAVHSPETPSLNAQDRALSHRFDQLFGNGHPNSPAFAAATRAAYALFTAYYHDHTDATRWVFFNDIGAWGTMYLDRAAATTNLQYSNTLSTAAYYQAFTDGAGAPLDAVRHGFVLTFSRSELPEAKRFWSLTAYLPKSVTLVPNPADKYVVASYTPGLHVSQDGSVSIYMTPTKPAGVPSANWLPVPAGPFTVVLRNYGPEGSAADGTYVPPAIMPFP